MQTNGVESKVLRSGHTLAQQQNLKKIKRLLGRGGITALSKKCGLSVTSVRSALMTMDPTHKVVIAALSTIRSSRSAETVRELQELLSLEPAQPVQA